MSAHPQPIATVLAQLLARRGYAQVQSRVRFDSAWQQAVGEPWVAQTRAGQLRRGVWEIICRSSTLIQELSFQKPALLERLAELLPDATIRDLRFRVGVIESPP